MGGGESGRGREREGERVGGREEKERMIMRVERKGG